MNIAHDSVSVIVQKASADLFADVKYFSKEEVELSA